jgi:hypothetical protein
MTIAQIMLTQIQKNTLMCIGAHQLTSIENGMRMMTRIDNQRRFIEITLNGMDLYDLKQVLVRGGKLKTVYEAKDIFCEDLDNCLFHMGSTRHATASELAPHGIRKA